MEATAQERVGLRERKKEHRRQAILTAARELFAQAGYESTTIESIAEHVGISGVTVHNYFGTKSGVLLALVAESDAVLCDEIDDRLANAPEDTVGLVLYFAQTVRQHAISYLDRALWRHVLAASVLEGNSRFGRSYHALDRQLARALGRQLERLQALGAVPGHVDTTVLGTALFDVQNTTFARFVSDESLDEATVDAWLERDLSALVSIGFAST